MPLGLLDASLAAPELVEDQLSDPSDAMVEAASMMAGPVGVLGAGGKMGLHVARMARLALDRAGRASVPVIAISRFSSLRAQEEFESRGIKTVTADLLCEQTLKTLPDLGTVYFLAGMKFGSSEKPEALRLYNETMPARVAERYRDAIIVALSTGCVYPFVTPESGGCSEREPAKPQGQYAVSCFGREQAFAKASIENGTKVALIRLNYAAEYRYGVLVDIAQKVLAGESIDVTMGFVNVIWQRDAVEHVLRAEAVAASPATVLNVAGKPIVSVRELAGNFGRLFGKEPQLEGAEALTAWLNDASRSHARFGEPQVSLDEMIDRVAGWLLNGRDTYGKPTKFEVRDGKF